MGYSILLLFYCKQPERLFFMDGGKTRYYSVFEVCNILSKCMNILPKSFSIYSAIISGVSKRSSPAGKGNIFL